MHVFGGLRREDWEHWGELTTFKVNAAELLRRELRGDEVVYCSPLVDPYQPAERAELQMPAILEVLIDQPPRVFVIQTRSPAILRDMTLLRRLAERTELRVSVSVTTDRDDIRRIYEPHCESNAERLAAIAELVSAGIRTFATLAPLLPCDPEVLAGQTLSVSREDLVGDPLHTRFGKRHGATTRPAAAAIAERQGHGLWFDPGFQAGIVKRIGVKAREHGRKFATGPEGFSWLCRTQ